MIEGSGFPVDDPAFWKKRLNRAVARSVDCSRSLLFTSVYDDSAAVWDVIQEAHRKILHEIVKPGMTVLDAGCGYGSGVALLPSGIRYLGIDISPDFIELARNTYPGKEFYIGDLRNLRCFGEGDTINRAFDDTFDIAFCRSVEGMVKQNLGEGEWEKMEKELLRVAKRLALLEYSEPDKYRMLPS